MKEVGDPGRVAGIRVAPPLGGHEPQAKSRRLPRAESGLGSLIRPVAVSKCRLEGPGAGLAHAGEGDTGLLEPLTSAGKMQTGIWSGRG